MILAVHGHRSFNDYPIFLAGMGKAMRNLAEGDREIFVYTAGPRRVNEMCMEWRNVSDFKAYGLKVQIRKIPVSWIKENMPYLDYLAYFGIKGESIPDILKIANSKDIPNDMYRYHNVA